MSKYTTLTKTVCEYFAGMSNTGYDDIEHVLNNSWSDIFSTQIPIYSESYRAFLMKKILRHFYMREIGQETVGYWKLMLNNKLMEIMPYYNKLYISAAEEMNIDWAVEHTLTRNLSVTSSSAVTTSIVASVTASATASTNNLSIYSDTPQGQISNLSNNGYMTNATKDDGGSHSSDSSRSSSSNNTQNRGNNTEIETTSGRNKSASFLLKDWRESFTNIDKMILDELEECFMCIW